MVNRGGGVSEGRIVHALIAMSYIAGVIMALADANLIGNL